ncbi:flippase [Floridanema aerugineum]|uniref:Flippase n=1 Tax=Floridaenema aerugineum BLCC-F46 TaxID=3153654 RepID=A0ABV4WZC5_9CYAN
MLTKILKIQQKLSPNFRKVIANIFWLMADNVLRLGIGLIVGVWVARYLGPQQFGLLNYSVAFVGLFSVFAKLGLDSIAIRELVRNVASGNEILGTTFILKLVGGIISFLLAIATILLIRTDDPESLWVTGIIALSLIFQIFDGINLWFQSQVQSKYVVYAKNGAYILANAIKILLIQAKAPLIFFAVITLGEVVFSALGLVIVYRLTGHLFKTWKFNFPLARDLLKESWPNILTGFSIAIYMRVDQLMLGSMIGDEAVGIYSVGVRLAEIWYFVPVAISSSVNPAIIQAKQEGEESYYRRIQKALNLVVVLGYALGIGTAFLAKPIITLLYGAKFIDASAVLSIYIWAGVFVSLGLIRAIWITTEGMFRFGSLTTFMGAGMNILLNFLLIPRYEGTGAAIATVISYGFSDYLVLLIYPPSRKIGWAMTRALALDFIISKLPFFRRED